MKIHDENSEELIDLFFTFFRLHDIDSFKNATEFSQFILEKHGKAFNKIQQDEMDYQARQFHDEVSLDGGDR